MMKINLAVISSAALLCFVTAALALDQPPQIIERTVAAGNKTQISQYHQLRTDCAPLGKVVVRITTPPKNGTVEIEDGEVVPNFEKDNILFSCNGKKVSGSRLLYTSSENFVGKDAVEVEAFFPQGSSRKEKYIITVK